jgi:hypothetical protein
MCLADFLISSEKRDSPAARSTASTSSTLVWAYTD